MRFDVALQDRWLGWASYLYRSAGLGGQRFVDDDLALAMA